MKRIFSLLLVIAVILSVAAVSTLSVAAAMPSPALLDGYENICLTYTYRPHNYDYGQQTVNDLLPYVAYMDESGNMKDFFFDSYLFLPYVTNGISGASIHGGPKDPTKAIDWVDYVKDTFCDNNNVAALDKAMGMAKSALGNSDKKAGVFFTILYPSYTATGFGTLGGRSLDLSKEKDRQYAIKWIIDEQVKLYEKAGYKNLDLVGFYWLEEEIYSEYDEAMMKYASDYLHSLGLKFIWIPWYQAPGYYKWQTCGFDVTCMQPNDMWSQTSNVTRVNTCASICNSYGMSMQIEASGHCDEPEYYERYLRYLEGGMNSGAMKSVKFYYQEGRQGVYYDACYSKDATFRSVYDLTYKYAKGTLTQADLYGEVEEIRFEMPEGIDWVSYGKGYEGCDSYVDGNGMAYQNVSGTELTDGIFGNSELGTEWHAFHVSLKDSEGRLSTTVDLGEVYTDLTNVVAQFLDDVNSGVRAPKDVKLYISEDGENFELLSDISLEKDDNMHYINYSVDEPFSARYVKMSFLNSNSTFVFCSEFMAGRPMTETEEDSTSTDSESADSAESASEETEAEVEAEAEDNNAWLYVRIGISVLLIVALTVIFFIKRKK